MSKKKRVKTLVVGGGGFIGQRLVHRLVSEGHRTITVLGRRPEPRLELGSDVKYVSGNSANPFLMAELLADCNELVDLAYGTVPKTSFDDPIHDLQTNLPPTVSLLRQASLAKVERVMLISSGGTVYGNAEYLPIDELHPTNPLSPYGITKLAAEKYALLYHRTEGLPVIIARPGNPYGPNQVLGRGQGFVGAAIAAVLSGKCIGIFGERGTIRDYIHIDDLADGLLATLDYGNPGCTYNIGSGCGHDNRQVLELLDVIVSRSGYRLEFEILPHRPFDVDANILDSASLMHASGWRPKVSLAEGIERTWAWASRGVA